MLTMSVEVVESSASETTVNIHIIMDIRQILKIVEKITYVVVVKCQDEKCSLELQYQQRSQHH
jgi:hypothetical protein